MQNLRRILKQPMTVKMSVGGDLRTGHGGHVPGSGSGDKVPAKYEPGEFVVSNDMLNDAPGLREQLHGLRSQVLAAKGTTPAEADTKAMGYDTDSTRSQNGQTNSQLNGSVPGGSPLREGASLRGNAKMDGRLGGESDSYPTGGQRNSGTSSKTGVTLRAAAGFGGIPGMDAFERPFTSADSRMFAADAGPGNPNVGPSGSSQAQAFRAPPVAPPVAAPEVPSAEKTGRVRSAVSATGNFLTGAGESSGSIGGAFKNVLSPVASVGNSALKLAGKASPYLGIGSAIYGGATTSADQYADRLGVDNSDASFGKDLALRGAGMATDAIGYNKTDTETYAKRFGLEKTQPSFLRDLGVRALGVGSDIASFGQAKRLDDPVVGAKPATASAAATPTGSSTPAPTAAYNTPGADATMPGQDPARGPLLRGQGGMDMGNGVGKFTQNGKTLYSNVTTPGDNDKLMSGRPGVSTVPGMSREQIDATLGGRSADQTFGDNAIRAANLRDGVDMNRGVGGNGPTMSVIGDGGGFGLLSNNARRERSLQMDTTSTKSNLESGAAYRARITGAANSLTGFQNELSAAPDKIRADATLRRGQDVTARVADANNRLTARGQDVTERDNIRTNQTSLANSAASNKLGVFNAQREQDNFLSTQRNGRDDAAFAQRETSRKALNDQIAGMLPTTPEGKPDLDTAARYSTALNADLAAKQQQLTADVKAGKPGAAAALDDLQRNGHGALGETYMRNLVNGMKVKDLAEKYSTSRFNPTGGRAVIDDAPRTGLRKSSNGFFGFGGSYTNDQGDDIPARAIEGDGSYIGGLRRNDLVKK